MGALPAARPAASTWLRLRQVCLVAENLEREARLVGSLFGLDVCYRDPNVAKYGLANVLFPIGTDFLEIVSPTRPGTAAGRFLERNDGRYGYMIIMDCAQPSARQAHCESIGVRAANVIRHEAYLGLQLHPKDTGGAMLEFNRTEGGEDSMGPYSPAGPGWQKFLRRDVTRRLVAAEIECANPDGFSARWSEILQKPSRKAEGGNEIGLDPGLIRFRESALGHAVLAGIELQVANRAAIQAKARELGCLDHAGEVQVCGIRVRLSEAVRP